MRCLRCRLVAEGVDLAELVDGDHGVSLDDLGARADGYAEGYDEFREPNCSPHHAEDVDPTATIRSTGAHGDSVKIRRSASTNVFIDCIARSSLLATAGIATACC